jgi:DNA-binding NtrC family response regulator
MERASVLTRGPKITPADLPSELNQHAIHLESDLNLSQQLATVEQNCLKNALSHSGGNRTEAARLLGISRKNLWEKLKSYGLQ